MTNYPSSKHIYVIVNQLYEARIDHWLGDTLGSWRWWVLIGVLILPWFIWYRLVDKKKLPELVLFGLVIMVFASSLDEIGFVTGRWSYPVEVVPMLLRLVPADYTVLPITFMLIYQYCPTWKRYFWRLVIISSVFAFIAEPLLVYFGFYILINWFYWYSFIGYIIMGSVSRWIVRKIFDTARS